MATALGEDITISSGTAELIPLGGTRAATTTRAGEVTSTGHGEAPGDGKTSSTAKIHHDIKVVK